MFAKSISFDENSIIFITFNCEPFYMLDEFVGFYINSIISLKLY